MMGDLKALLQAAAGSGEIFTIVYHGGSRPGHARRIVPMAIQGDKLIAADIDQGSSRRKMFLLHKIAGAEASSGEKAISNDVPALTRGERLVDELHTLHDFDRYLRQGLESAGWTVLLEENESLVIYNSYKNGKRYKNPTAGILYQPIKIISTPHKELWDLEPGEQQEFKTTEEVNNRPWEVFSSYTNTYTFKHIHKAFDCFLDAVRLAETRKPPPVKIRP